MSVTRSQAPIDEDSSNDDINQIHSNMTFAFPFLHLFLNFLRALTLQKIEVVRVAGADPSSTSLSTYSSNSAAVKSTFRTGDKFSRRVMVGDRKWQIFGPGDQISLGMTSEVGACRFISS